jgi:hypothetical protein
MSEAILKKIPAEMRWEITAKCLTGATIGYQQALLEIVGKEKADEVEAKMWGEGGKTFIPMIKEAFNIPVEDAIGAANLVKVAAVLGMGPECTDEIIEETKERVVQRWVKCPFMERAKEMGVIDKHDCYPGCTAWTKGLNVINPKLNIIKTKKAMPRGDPYCEWIYEFKA